MTRRESTKPTTKTKTPHQQATPLAPEAGKTSSEIDRLATMKIGELQALYAGVTGEKTRCPNRGWLVKKIMEASVPSSGDSTVEFVAPAADVQVEAAAVPVGAHEDPTKEPAGAGNGSPSPGAGIKLSKLEVPALQALYIEEVGRPTQSSNSAYLIWKIREARRGRIPTGPRKNARANGTTFKVLPLRMASDMVDKLDEARRRQGLATRMDLFRIALRTYLAGVGETEIASLLDPR